MNRYSIHRNFLFIFFHLCSWIQLRMASCGFLLWTRRPLQCWRFAHVSLTNANYGEYISIQEYNIFIICNRFGGRIEHHRKSKTRSWTGSSKWVNSIPCAFWFRFKSKSNANANAFQSLFVCIAFHFIYDAKKNELKNTTFNRIFLSLCRMRCRDHEFLSIHNLCICYSTGWIKRFYPSQMVICWRKGIMIYIHVGAF